MNTPRTVSFGPEDDPRMPLPEWCEHWEPEMVPYEDDHYSDDSENDDEDTLIEEDY